MHNFKPSRAKLVDVGQLGAYPYADTGKFVPFLKTSIGR